MARMRCPECRESLTIYYEDLGETMECPCCDEPFVVTEDGLEAIERRPRPRRYDDNYGRRPVTIEQTSKTWKVVILIGLLLLFGGVAGCVAERGGSTNVGAPIAGLGLAVLFAGKLGAWWDHG